jgi:hypothetical protein
MNVKKIITGLALSMLLSSGATYAGWDDVYYCKDTQKLLILLNGLKQGYVLETFKFKLDKTKNAMVFGNKDFTLKNLVIKLTEDFNWPNKEKWRASNESSMFYFEKGKFLMSKIITSGSRPGVYSRSADCEMF